MWTPSWGSSAESESSRRVSGCPIATCQSRSEASATAAADQAIATTTTKQLTSRVRKKAEARPLLLPVLELDCGSARAGFARSAGVSQPLIVIVARS